jgi:hypothetical protein
MGLTLIGSIATGIALLTWCKPVAANWDPTKGTCKSRETLSRWTYFISSVSIITDWSCAILPAFMLWSIQLRMRVKVSLIIVLSLGAL